MRNGEQWHIRAETKREKKSTRYAGTFERCRTELVYFMKLLRPCISLSVSFLRELTNLIKLVSRCKLAPPCQPDPRHPVASRVLSATLFFLMPAIFVHLGLPSPRKTRSRQCENVANGAIELSSSSFSYATLKNQNPFSRGLPSC